ICAIAVIFEVGVGLMMKLEQFISLPGKGIVPTSGIPCPRNALVAQAISNGRHSLWWHEVICLCGTWVRCKTTEGGIHDEPIRRHRAVFAHDPVGIELDQHISRRVRECRRAGTGQPEAIQERTTKRSMKEVVA